MRVAEFPACRRKDVGGKPGSRSNRYLPIFSFDRPLIRDIPSSSTLSTGRVIARSSLPCVVSRTCRVVRVDHSKFAASFAADVDTGVGRLHSRFSGPLGTGGAQRCSHQACVDVQPKPVPSKRRRAGIHLSEPTGLTATFVKKTWSGAPSAVPRCSVETKSGPAFL